MITLLLLGMFPAVCCAEGAVCDRSSAMKQLLGSVIIRDYIIYDKMQTFAEAMDDLCARANESRPDQKFINLVVRSKKYETEAKTPKMRGLELQSASVHDILLTLERRKDLLFRICGNVVFVVGPGVPLRNSFSETYGKCRIMNEQLDSIFFPAVMFEKMDVVDVISFLREKTSRFSPDKKEVAVSHAFTGKEMEFLPPVTLDLRFVSLRELLDSICFVTGCAYAIHPDRIVFYFKK